MKRALPLLMFTMFSLYALAQQAPSIDLIISNCKVINMADGSITQGQSVAIKNGKIIDVHSDKYIKNKYQAAQYIQAEGRYVMPGLWDMHMHFGGGDSTLHENKNFLALYLAHGVTSIRDMAADISKSVVKWRDEINNDQLTGPRIFTSGPKLEGYKPIWKGVLQVGTPEEVESALDSLQKLNVDFVKITENTLKPDIYLYALKAVKARGLRSSAHIPSSLTLNEVIDAGLNSVEHLGYAYNAGIPKAATASKASQFNAEYAKQQYRYMANHHVFITPTLLGSYIISHLDEDSHTNDAYLKYIGRGIKNTYSWRVDRAKNISAEASKQRHENYDNVSKILPLLQSEGVKIMAGTDAGYLNSFVYPGIGIHQELALMVKAGLSPLQALQASVVNSPAFLGLTEYGSVAKDKRADLILLDQNPIENIEATQKIHSVIVKGVVFDRRQLDKFLKDVADQNVSGL
ncbi:amidohydrolase family protein [Olivibacter domesticus]|nr:amidohydrolase family protein [Olivibacter domesticus]